MLNSNNPNQDQADLPDRIDRLLRSLLTIPTQTSRASVPPSPLRELGTTPFARQLGLTDEQTNGHWCSRCQGVWYGYTLEVQCPVCGNRKG